MPGCYFWDNIVRVYHTNSLYYREENGFNLDCFVTLGCNLITSLKVTTLSEFIILLKIAYGVLLLCNRSHREMKLV